MPSISAGKLFDGKMHVVSTDNLPGVLGELGGENTVWSPHRWLHDTRPPSTERDVESLWLGADFLVFDCDIQGDEKTAWTDEQRALATSAIEAGAFDGCVSYLTLHGLTVIRPLDTTLTNWPTYSRLWEHVADEVDSVLFALYPDELPPARVDRSTNEWKRLFFSPTCQIRTNGRTEDREGEVITNGRVDSLRVDQTLAEIAPQEPQEQPRAPAGKRKAGQASRGLGYLSAALGGLTAEIRNAPGSTRNNTVNRCTFRMGCLIERQGLPEFKTRAYEALLEAAIDSDPDRAEEYEKRIAEVLNVGQEQAKGEEPPKRTKARLVRLSDVAPQVVRWIWRPYIPREKLVLLEGDPEAGKTWLLLRIVAALTRGEPLPGEDPNIVKEPETVIYLSNEDGLEDTLVPRLQAMGADMKHVYAIPFVDGRDENGRQRQIPLRLDDVEILKDAIREVDAGLVCIDPIQSYLGAELDVHRMNEVRQALDGVNTIMRDEKTSFICNRHFAKMAYGNPLYRGLGSIDFVATARSVLHAGKEYEDGEWTGRRVMAQAKCSLERHGPSYAFEIGEGPTFHWRGEVDMTADDLARTQRTSQFGGEKSAAAVKFLIEFLRYGAKPMTEVLKAAEDAGIAEKTLRRAAKSLKVGKRKTGLHGGWTWKMPE